MQQFKIREDGFKELRWKIISQVVAILLVAVAGGVYMCIMDGSKYEENVNILPIIIPVLLITLCVGLYIGLRRQKAIFESYTLTITENMISREQQNTHTISLYRNEIVEITKQKNGSITITGNDPEDLIGVPAQIERYVELEVLLQDIQPIANPKQLPIWQRYPLIVGLLTLLLMVSTITSNNKIIVVLTGTPLIAILTLSYKMIQSSKNVDDRTKKSSRFVLLVLAAIICNIIFKLTGWVH